MPRKHPQTGRPLTDRDIISALIGLTTLTSEIASVTKDFFEDLREFPTVHEHSYFCVMSQTFFNAAMQMAAFAAEMQRLAKHEKCTARMIEQVREQLDGLLDGQPQMPDELDPEVAKQLNSIFKGEPK